MYCKLTITLKNYREKKFFNSVEKIQQVADDRKIKELFEPNKKVNWL